ncbi:MAG: hypothetical protein CFE21_11175 [Bacteroidetes bacterium B1(2017)]|nr:MAG: hypothetical protein CFE21_11175 [Bacteroidetes bacterium B1(2017)]
MKNLLLFLFSILVLNQTQAQTISAVKVCDLPSELSETSGLVKIGPNKFVSHTDSGNEPKLFVFDSLGTIQRRIKVNNATNVDWEDITLDTKGNIWIGDFGNNANDRTNLKIYMVASPNTYTKDSTVAGILNFTYPDQKAFPPAAGLQNFDMEAFFWFNDSLYLFSKNRTNPYTGYTKCYQLPAKLGTFTAKLIDSFYTGSGGYLNYSITSAAVYPNGNKMILLGYDKCWLFTPFSGTKFLKGTSHTLAFSGLSQKEAIFFESANKLWYTQETSPLGTAGLYRFELPNLTASATNKLYKRLYKVYPNPANEILNIELAEEIAESEMLLEVLNMEGKLVLKSELNAFGVNEVSIKNLKNGTYFMRINGLNAGEFIKQ